MTTPGRPSPKRPCRVCVTPTANTGGRCDTHTRERHKQTNQRSAYYQSVEWRALRRACLARDHNVCVVCTDTYRLTAHHIHARELGGPDVLENLVTLCGRCHSSYETGDRRVAEHLRLHLDVMRSRGHL